LYKLERSTNPSSRDDKNSRNEKYTAYKGLPAPHSLVDWALSIPKTPNARPLLLVGVKTGVVLEARLVKKVLLEEVRLDPQPKQNKANKLNMTTSKTRLLFFI
jgi:hypothetical protein